MVCFPGVVSSSLDLNFLQQGNSMPDKDQSWHLVKERHTWLYGMVGPAGARQWAGYHGVRLGSARGMGGPCAHSIRCPLPLLVYPKPGQTCSRFRDASGLECSVGLGIPQMESSALCPEARLIPAGTL